MIPMTTHAKQPRTPRSKRKKVFTPINDKKDHKILQFTKQYSKFIDVFYMLGHVYNLR